MYNDGEEADGHKFIISGGEVVELDMPQPEPTDEIPFIF